MSDHIFNEQIIVKLKNRKINEDEVILAIDYNIERNHFVDHDDVTKVFIKDSKVLSIGKDINKYNAFDTGIFLCTQAIFNAIEKSVENGDTTLSGGMRLLAERGKVKTFDINVLEYRKLKHFL